MGMLSLFHGSRRATATPATAVAAPVLWRKTPFECFTAGHDQHLVSRRGSVPVAVPSFAVDFLLRCNEFRSMERHVARHVESHDWSPLQVEALTQLLPQFVEAGLLVSPEDLRARCAAMIDPANTPAPVEVVGVPTGGARTAMLERCLRGFGANFATHNRAPEVVVFDSSARPEDSVALHALLTGLKGTRGLKLRWAGAGEKRRFAEELVRRSGVRASSVEFALFDPLNAGFTCGANRNALLLHEAGRTTVSVDDDVVAEISPGPAAKARVSLFATDDPCERWFFADRASALAAAPFTDVDFLGTHESLLGRDIGALFPPDLKAEEIDVSCVDDQMLKRLDAGPLRVRTTFFGQVGDTGTPTSSYHFYAKGKTRERLTSSEELYRGAFTSRSVVVRPPCPTIGGGLLSPGMTIGLDHREILPPFFPVLHAEDTLFAAATWLCCSRSVSGHLPYALHHDSGQGKTIHHPDELSPERRATVFEFATIVRAILFHCRPPEHADAAERIRTLGRNVSAYAAQPARDFLEALRLTVQQMEADKLAYLEDRLREEEDAPDYWRSDLEKFILHTREAMTYGDFDIPFDLKTQRSDEENRRFMQALLMSYGALLEDWPAMVQAARELRESGLICSTAVGAE